MVQAASDHQHQCALPLEGGEAVLRQMLETCHAANHGSFLTVLKRFGAVRSPGIMSFPIEGFTLTLDFPNRGETTHALLDRLDQITLEAGGRVNPYKDSRMKPETFRRGFPLWQTIERLRDPAMMSDFWRRVSDQAGSS